MKIQFVKQKSHTYFISQQKKNVANILFQSFHRKQFEINPYNKTIKTNEEMVPYKMRRLK